MFSLIDPLNSLMYPLLMSTTSPSLTLSMLSSHNVRRTEPVSSPTNASVTLWVEPSRRETTSLIGFFDTTFTVRFKLRDPGFKFPTCSLTPIPSFSDNVYTHFLNSFFRMINRMT